MSNNSTIPTLNKKTAHSDNLVTLAEEAKQKLQTDSENPAFENLANNPELIKKKDGSVDGTFSG